MERSRIFLYSVIAVAVLLFFYVILANEPSQDGPVNFVHLIFRH